MRQIVLSILVENTPGVLSRISGLFTRRGYNIDSITACTTQDQKFSRITIAVSGETDQESTFKTGRCCEDF